MSMSPPVSRMNSDDFAVVEITVGLSSPRKKPPRKTKSRRTRLTRGKQRGLYKCRKKLPSKQTSPLKTVSDAAEHSYAQITSSTEVNPSDVTGLVEGEAEIVGDESAGAAVGLRGEISKTDKIAQFSPPTDAISEALGLLQALLPENWIVIADEKGFHFLQLASSIITAVQREIYLRYDGIVTISVHCVPLPTDNDIIKKALNAAVFQDENYKDFCQKGLTLCWEMTQYQACAGADFEAARALWHDMASSYIDLNPYLETVFETSCRSYKCSRLIPLRINAYRCSECSQLLKILKERYKSAMNENPCEKTPNIHLTKEQSKAKLGKVQAKLRKSEKRRSYLEFKIERLQALLENEGVDLEENDSKYFANILEKSNLTEMQQLFLDQQFKYASISDPRAHRWHPAIIRLAIKIKSDSSAAYETLRDSGFVSLPHSRTLFDYTHFIKMKVGINKDLLKMFAEKVHKEGNPENQFHALIFGEMYISQNLIYRKSDGALMGYTYLDNVDKEINNFESFLDGKTEVKEAPLASTILAFMVKGLTSNVKMVIASYPCKDLNKNMISARVWEVISQCEGANVKILSVVCDGCPSNRGFIKLHTPIHPTESGIVYDTLNIFSEDERPLFFCF